MGEARRRQLAGTKPTAGPVEAFRCPAGSVAFTFDIEGADPSTVVFRADSLTDALAGAAGLIPPGVPYPRLAAGFAAEFRRTKATGCSDNAPGLGLVGGWLAMNHPGAGERMRRAVSVALCRDNQAHVTLRIGAGGLAIALAPAFVELADATAAVAAAGTAVVVTGAAPEPAPIVN